MLTLRTLSAGLLGSGLFLGAALAQKPSGDGKKPAAPTDVPLVEALLGSRAKYQDSLEKLRKHYLTVGDMEKARWAEEELRQYHRLAKQPYRLDMDVPPPTLQASYNVPEANALYKQAMMYKDKGWATDYTDNQRRAEILLQQLLTQYPQCDKIGDAAYQLAEIYESRAYKQFRRAASYYERSFQWTTATQSDARLRAARLYDRQLLDRGRAVELYKEVTTHDTDPKRIAEAEKRLGELSSPR